MRGIRQVAAVVAILTVLAVASSARAQPASPGGMYRPGVNPTGLPTYSPYLNLLRPGGSVTQNYFGLVRPELNFRASVSNLQQQVTGNQQAIGGFQAEAGLPTTGHRAVFMNYGGYFGGLGGGASRPGISAGFGAGRQMTTSGARFSSGSGLGATALPPGVSGIRR